MRLNRRNFTTGLALTALASSALTAGWPGSAIAAADVDVDELMKPGPLGDKILGSADAPVTIVEYASMTCPHCANFHTGTYPELKKKYIDTGKVRFIFREFVFPNDGRALAAFMLARCADDDKYFPMIEVLFEQQAIWARGDNPREDLFKIARSAGLTQEEFDACLKNVDIANGVRAVTERGNAEFGVSSTPTFFINGEMLKGNQPIEKFDEMIGGLIN